MAPAERQLLQLLIGLLLLNSVTVFAAFLQHSPVMSGGHPLAHQALTTLLSGPLSGQNLLLVTDDDTQRLLDLGQVMAAAGSSLTPVLLATQNSIFDTHRPAHQTKGSLLTALLLFHQDPTKFLLFLADNTNWNPSYLVLFCLNPTLNTTTVLSQPVVQRSQFILLLQTTVKSGRHYLSAFTSFPLLVNGRGHPLTKAPIGIWNPEKFPSRQSIFTFRMYDFGGKVLQVPTLCYDQPFMYVDTNTKQGHCKGMNVDALNIIARKLNFKFSMRASPSLNWGNKINGTWNGMLGELMYEGKDIFINEIQNTPDRASDFDYIYPYWATGFGFMLLVPPPLPQWKNILYPFSTLMWCLLLVTTLTSASILAFLLHRINNFSDPVGIALKIAAGLLNQCVNLDDVRVWWARIWLVFWWIAVDILAAAYTSNLITLLTVPVYPARLHTVQDLAASNIIPSIIDYGSFVTEAMKTSTNPTLATLGKRLDIDYDIVFEDLFRAIIKKVFKGTHAMMLTIDHLLYTQHRKNLTRTMYILDETIYQGYMIWFLPPNSPYTVPLSNHVQRLLETGILGKLNQDHVGRLNVQRERAHGGGVLSSSHLQGAFILLGLGVGVATFVLLMELYQTHRKNRVDGDKNVTRYINE